MQWINSYVGLLYIVLTLSLASLILILNATFSSLSRFTFSRRSEAKSETRLEFEDLQPKANHHMLFLFTCKQYPLETTSKSRKSFWIVTMNCAVAWSRFLSLIFSASNGSSEAISKAKKSKSSSDVWHDLFSNQNLFFSGRTRRKFRPFAYRAQLFLTLTCFVF